MRRGNVTAAVRVRREIIPRIREEARKTPELECCGLLAGRGGIITRVLPARNALESATAYEIAPAELFQLMRQIHGEDLEMLGIYHSHPRGENRPSPRDIASAFYSEAAYFIVSPSPNTPHPIRAFFIRDGQVTELQIEII